MTTEQGCKSIISIRITAIKATKTSRIKTQLRRMQNSSRCFRLMSSLRFLVSMFALLGWSIEDVTSWTGTISTALRFIGLTVSILASSLLGFTCRLPVRHCTIKWHDPKASTGCPVHLLVLLWWWFCSFFRYHIVVIYSYGNKYNSNISHFFRQKH